MRSSFSACFVALVVCAGCNIIKSKPNTDDHVRSTGKLPTSAELVHVMNDNAARIQSAECQDVRMDVRHGTQLFGLDAMMSVQKPRNFRLIASKLGSTEADIGSNNQEFWFYIKRNEPPYLYHCDYESFYRGNVRAMPFPFQPDWITTAMGIGEYDANKNYDVRPGQGRGTVELIEETMSPQGQRVKKVTVFNRPNSGNGQPQPYLHVLRDEKGKDICSAEIKEVQVDRNTGAVLPRRVVFLAPQEKMEMKLSLTNIKAVNFDQEKAGRLYSRATLNNLPGFDLSTGRPDNGEGIARVRGTAR